MVNLTIDGKSVSVPKNTTILEAARQVDIHIPTLCWLEKVSTTGACRICAVEIEGVDRPMTACNTPVKEGINVTTQSEQLKKSRKQIMELILVNHPLDCPVCDAGGECDLQDICYDLDVVRQEFQADDVNPETINHWPLIQQVPNRCILCEKCVKVCHELIGADALFVNEKGDRAFIDKKVENCTYCGNCVAVCPTGTMISKPFKFKARPWTLRKAPSVCTYCPSQCQIDLNVLNNEILRVTSEDAETTNKGTLCVGGFFGYSYINNQKRLVEPLVEQKPSSWEEAVDRVVADITKIKAENGPAAIAGFSSPHLTNEENYLFQKLFRAAIGSNNIDTEARFGALRALRALDKGLGLHGASNRMDVIGTADAVLVFGADPSAEAPAVDWKIQDAVRRGDGKLVIANMRQIHLTQFAESQLGYKPGSEIALANALGRLLLDRNYLDDESLKSTVSNYEEMKADLNAVDLAGAVEATGISLEAMEQAADIIGKANKVAVIFGADICKSAFGTSKAAAVANLAILSGALSVDGGLFPLDEKGNTQGVLNMGVYPEDLPGFQPYAKNKEKFAKAWRCELPDGGLDADGILQEIEAGTIRFLYLAATNPQNFPNSGRWLKALGKVEVLVVQDIFPTEITRLATVVLPGSTYAEKSGSFTSLDRTVRGFEAAIRPVGQCREDWEIFAELYARLSKNSMTQDREDVFNEVRDLTSLYADVTFLEDKYATCLQNPHQVADQSLKYQLISVGTGVGGLQLLTGTSAGHFGTTSIWAAAPLEVEPEGLLKVNGKDAEAAGISDGDEIKVTSTTGSTTGKVLISTSVPEGLIFAPHNFIELGSQQLMPDGDNLTPVQMTKI
ncbi:molybdopterin-dependent oxidoreductase [uncultured Desulfuromusa sp.]|uniref:molybdopterin-dependent oxidoreductase n=1 Tax=uncultured Desulfuromusa sp. TaxID=219183 RepID=UPI002AA64CCC|nr:molybdopterin-dependent oxidoreductase [uncultured Desulfuromusa sp.]